MNVDRPSAESAQAAPQPSGGCAQVPGGSGVVIVNLPDVLAEVAAVFARYEEALVNNKVDVLDELFWNAPTTVRYGATENLIGYVSIQAFRAARQPSGLARRLSNTVITTYGRDTATAMTEFHRDGSPRIGRQSQTWVRMPEGWRVVAAHVSFVDG